MAVIAILAALLLPALAVAKERARRASCKSSQRQFIQAAQIYANENNQFAPSGASEHGAEDDHTPVISSKTRQALLHYSGSYKVLDCPSLGEKFNRPEGWLAEENYGYVIGYNYLGGHLHTAWPPFSGITATWISPVKLTDFNTNVSRSPLALLSELNDWSPSYQGGKTFAPHCVNGAVLSGNASNSSGPGGKTSAEAGAAGGHVGMVDGSVSWTPIKEMKVYRGSQQRGADGCWAMW